MSLLLVAVPISLPFLHRIRIEERALTEALGEAYTVYSEKTARLVPRIL